MSEGNVLEAMKVKASRLSEDKDFPPQNSDPSVFYRCTCTRCGKDSLRLRGFGQIDQSPFVGVTGKGTLGLGYDLLDRDCHQGITCDACGYDAFLKGSEQSEPLLEWACLNGEQIPALGFTCQACGTHKLVQVQLEVEIHRGIAAVCEIASGAMPDKQAIVTLTGERLVLGGSPYRFRCENDHELAKDDGTPVESSEELVEWLKAHTTGDEE